MASPFEPIERQTLPVMVEVEVEPELIVGEPPYALVAINPVTLNRLLAVLEEDNAISTTA